MSELSTYRQKIDPATVLGIGPAAPPKSAPNTRTVQRLARVSLVTVLLCTDCPVSRCQSMVSGSMV